MKKLVILGCTGSIGAQALEIVSGSEELEVVGLAAGSSWEPVVEQASRHGVPAVALAEPAAAERAGSAWDGRVLAGEEGIRELVAGSAPTSSSTASSAPPASARRSSRSARGSTSPSPTRRAS